jgi:hypothetical protein
MNTWISTDAALDALDPIAAMTAEQEGRLAYFSALEAGRHAAPGSLRQRLAGSLLRLAIMLDPRAQAALIEANSQR